jgi:hypothetical protein
VLLDDTRNKIMFEIGEIESELLSYKTLFDLIKSRDPDLIEMTALSSVLHSFYNGIESIFILIAKHSDKKISSGEKWHNELLRQMASKTDSRTAVIDNEIFETLKEYLQFRHFVRHSYKWKLNWDEFKNLAINTEASWIQIKKQLVEFTADN